MAGAAVPPGSAARRLAGRLVDAGLLAPVPDDRPGFDDDLTVVIPVRDRPGGLSATLAALGDGCEVVVVDDGSTDPAAVVDAVAGRTRTRVVRRAVPGGPGAARNSGWRAATTGLVAFVDADCEPESGWTRRLCSLFADGGTVAVAPRVVAAPPPGGGRRLAAYEAVRSPLDLGGVAAPVRPGTRVAYVPTTALVVRRGLLVALGGFDESLRTGEDVDFIWRLAATGGRIRYDPTVTVAHPVRPTGRAWAAQRFGYGRSAAPLARRHGETVAPLVLPALSAAAWTLAAAGAPLAGLAVTVGATAAAAVDARPVPGAEVWRAGLAGQARAGRSVAEVLRRTWWPLVAAVAPFCSRVRRAALVAAVVAPLAEWAVTRPALDPVSFTVLRVADDVAYGAGVWAGVLAERSPRCLRPVVRLGR